ncbi:amidohydrolase family protein [candidate division KSB1 bacterium]|nr:amidohydrolase family protein [candidate division KSB1 bacterium]
MIKSWVVILFGFACVYAHDQIPAPPQTQPIALVGADLYTVSGEVIRKGTLVFDKGRIVSLGKNIEIPDDAEVIRIEGKRVYPGMILASSTLGLVEVSSVSATVDVSEKAQISPEVRAVAALNPDSELLPVTRSNGITLAVVNPRGGLIAGRSALIELDGWTWEDMAVEPVIALDVYWPSMQIDHLDKKSKKEQLSEIHKRIESITKAFQSARAFHRDREAKTDVRWQAMTDVFEKKMPVFVHANEIKQIQAAIDWSLQQNIRMILVGGYDAPLAADRLKKHHIPVILGDVHRLPMRHDDPVNTPFGVAAKLYKKSVQFCLSAGDGASMFARNLAFQAGTTVAHGLPYEQALKAVTLYPAEILGVANRVGSLEPGKHATLLVTDGDLLEIDTRIEMEFIQGRRVDLNNKHTMLYHKYLEKYKQKALNE